MLTKMASEPKRVSEFRSSGGTNPGLGQPEVIRVDPVAELGRKENDLGAVLAASNRAEASLSALHRAIQHVTDGVADARHANEHLNQELARVRDMLGASNEQRLGLKNQVTLLEEELSLVRAEAQKEREFLINDQDRFLAGVLEDHDVQLARVLRERDAAIAELAELKRSAAHTHPARKAVGTEFEDASPAHLLNRIEKLIQGQEAARETLLRLQAQRDDAQAKAKQLEQAVADARHEVAALRASGITAPPDPRRTVPASATQPDRPQSDGPVAEGDRPTLDAALGQRATVPPAPNELAQAIVASRPSPSRGTERQTSPQVPHPPLQAPRPDGAGAVTKAPLKRKPDPAQRPLGSYSVVGDAVDPETVVSSKPPRK